jgi:hypothetical protein
MARPDKYALALRYCTAGEGAHRAGARLIKPAPAAPDRAAGTEVKLRGAPTAQREHWTKRHAVCGRVYVLAALRALCTGGHSCLELATARSCQRKHHEDARTHLQQQVERGN